MDDWMYLCGSPGLVVTKLFRLLESPETTYRQCPYSRSIVRSFRYGPQCLYIYIYFLI